jgi:acyl dehydratase
MAEINDSTLFFEDVLIGSSYVTPEHTITAANIQAFCKLTLDHFPLHTDAQYARECGFPDIIAHGLFGLSLIEGLKTKLELYGRSSLASLGWDKVRFRQPLLPGDTVHVEFSFIAKRLSSKPGRGIVTESLQLLKQDQGVVIDAEHAALLRTRAVA